MLAGGLLQRWTGTAPENRQPRLDHHNVCLHLGGPKRVCRNGEGETRTVEIGPGAITVVPIGSSFCWNTEGTIDFAFLFVEPRRLSRIVVEEFDRDPDTAALQDSVGVEDPLLGPLLSAMTEEIAAPGPFNRPLMESLYQAVLVRLLCTHSRLPERAVRARYTLAPFRLRRVLHRIESDLGGVLDLDAMAAAAGLSRYHFSRAFRQATGVGPCAFVLHRRIEEAKRLLDTTTMSIADVAKRCGLGEAMHFSTAFRKQTGQSPSSWRRQK
jgi:AraC family transcriptional regulator